MVRIDEIVKTNLKDDRYRMFVNLIYTTSWMTSQFDALTKPFGLSRQQFNILRILRGINNWMSLDEIKSRMIEKAPNSANLCERLEQRKLIEIKHSTKTAREVKMRITSNGLAMLTEIGTADDKKILSFLNNLTEQEANTITNLLDKLRG